MTTPIFIHAFLALLAIPMGLYIFSTTKGTPKHKLLGQVWIIILVIVSISAIFIQEINSGEYSLVHLLIPYTLIALTYSIWNIRKFRQTREAKYKRAHMRSMIGVYLGALILAGALTLLPGRIFHEMLFSTNTAQHPPNSALPHAPARQETTATSQPPAPRAY
ncbi:MAG: DUF2306 domain-containing protein [Pseudohongiellaceae bacterium]